MTTKPYIIAGPCSAETEEQTIETAKKIKSIGQVDVFRAGIWKPRTNPGGFEGIGLIGLSWLLNVKKETGLKTGVEVATAEHVNNALQFDTDVLWIGARTTVNPFSVQEIADALRGTNVKVLIKNPVNPDLKLWIGAYERLHKAGIEDIGLIHRGFTSPVPTGFRNAPMWQIPIEVRRLLPNVPMLVDPSHICGARERLLEVTQHALNLGYEGAMIETHITPDSAWTDKDQQITPETLSELINELGPRKTDGEPGYQELLSAFRDQINLMDNELLQLLKNRMDVVVKIGELKKLNQMTVYQTGRWNEILQKTVAVGTQLGLQEEFVRGMMELIHLESIRKQEEVIEKVH
jgi:chorismate mutase